MAGCKGTQAWGIKAVDSMVEHSYSCDLEEAAHLLLH